ncbi:MAG: succinate dehydrogenase, hydrophobic membrane anchor protein [Steroidobacteraceae bacterium]|jgi:succinate dehydrogenase / fumarate reductase membrane anchor subunit|nr:succinate dehydrogenase, hydrophobic membrane anchor protein [Steroidobacteraceae bacterium]
MSLRSPLGRVLGQGSAGGSHHWWTQRVGSVALIPLGLWFAVSLGMLPDHGYETVHAWLAKPVNAVLMLVMVPLVAHHSHLGMQVVIEDYVHSKGRKVAVMLFSQFAHVLLAAAAFFAVLRVAFAGTTGVFGAEAV